MDWAKWDFVSRPMYESPFWGGKSTGTGVTSESTQLSQSSEDIQQKQTDDSDGDLATSDSQQLSTSLPNLNSPQVSAVLATVELDKGTEKAWVARLVAGFWLRLLIGDFAVTSVAFFLYNSIAWCLHSAAWFQLVHFRHSLCENLSC